MPSTRSARSLAAAALVLGLTAVLSGAGRLLTPRWDPQAPDYRRRGPATAKVVIAEFSDFECPACAAAAPHLKSIEDLHKGDVAVVFKHRAWDFHPHAREAADAAECAGRQNKFWDFGDKLFGDQATWTVMEGSAPVRAYFMKTAGQLNLDETAFAACLADPKTDEPVAADLKEAEEKWVRATPTFVIGGRRFVGGNQLRTLGLNRVEDMIKKGKS